MPGIARGMPQLVEQAVLKRHQPLQQCGVERDALAGLGEGALERDKTVVLLGQRQRSVQTLHTATQGATASVAKHAPDFIKTETELVIWQTVAALFVARRALRGCRLLDYGRSSRLLDRKSVV